MLCIQTAKDVAALLLDIITGATLIMGILYVRSLKQKAYLASFSFWSQIRTRIETINFQLKKDPRLISHLYPKEAISLWEETEPSESDLKLFMKDIIETKEFLSSTSDQFPAYKGWTDDFSKFVEFLNIAIVYDLSNQESDGYYSDKNNMDRENRNKQRDELCKCMDSLVNGIINKQKEIEKALF